MTAAQELRAYLLASYGTDYGTTDEQLEALAEQAKMYVGVARYGSWRYSAATRVRLAHDPSLRDG